jgi:DNA-binding HxlR family transcriptional regulator
MSPGHPKETGGPARTTRKRPRYDVYAPNCPTRLVLARLADKWTVLILGRLDRTPLRFNQLRREIAGVSQKVLSQTLKSLERDGLVARKVFPTVPVTVEYAITPLGLTLQDTLQALGRWAETHMDAVLAAQRQYDRRTPAHANSPAPAPVAPRDRDRSSPRTSSPRSSSRGSRR